MLNEGLRARLRELEDLHADLERQMTDPEVLEWRFPVLLESFAIRRGSGGRGRWMRSRRRWIA
jgi:N-methylhydantoinase B/oxoprolinase/acetone carboxylase alpha subunit